MSRPRADAIEVADLLEEARRGRYAVPFFQRGLKWETADRIKLFDSIYSGFPIGDLLLWDTTCQPSGRPDFGPFQPRGQTSARLWVVDGQQRLVTLLGCLDRSAEASPEKYPLAEWIFAFDTDVMRVVIPNDGGSPIPHLLPLADAMDIARYLPWVRRLPDDGERDRRIAAADDFSKALRQYRIPYYVITTDDEELLRKVFERVNNTGRRLDHIAVFHALFGGVDPVEGLGSTAEEISRDLGCGDIEEDLLLKAAKAIVGLDPTAELGAGLRSTDAVQVDGRSQGSRVRKDLRSVLPRVRASMIAAVATVQSAGVLRLEAIPVPVVLSVLAHLFDAFQGDARPDDPAIHRYFWRASVAGVRSSRRSTFLKAAARIIRAGARDGRSLESVLKELVTFLGPPEPDLSAWILQQSHDWRSAATRVVALALFELQPRDPWSERPIDLWPALVERGHRVFPRIFTHIARSHAPLHANRLVSMERKEKGLGHSLAELAQRRILSVPEDVLRSNAIPTAAWEALAQGDREAFLGLRTKTMQVVVEEFLKARMPQDTEYA